MGGGDFDGQGRVGSQNVIEDIDSRESHRNRGRIHHLFKTGGCVEVGV